MHQPWGFTVPQSLRNALSFAKVLKEDTGLILRMDRVARKVGYGKQDSQSKSNYGGAKQGEPTKGMSGDSPLAIRLGHKAEVGPLLPAARPPMAGSFAVEAPSG